MFNEHYPIRAAAEQTAALEDEAKKLPGKNGAALFDAVPDHTYSWDVLQDKVLGEKMACLEQFFVDVYKRQRRDCTKASCRCASVILGCCTVGVLFWVFLPFSLFLPQRELKNPIVCSFRIRLFLSGHIR